MRKIIKGVDSVLCEVVHLTHTENRAIRRDCSKEKGNPKWNSE